MIKENIQFIKSLHRPYNSRLKTNRWVCEFAEVYKTKKGAKKNTFSIGFYLYLLEELGKFYSSNTTFDTYGLPSKKMVEVVNNFFKSKTKSAIVKEILHSTNSMYDNVDSIHKQIFSSYKSASYYITLSKNTFLLIDRYNRLTNKGQELLKLNKRGRTKLAQKEKSFFLKELVLSDLFMLILQIYFNRFEKKYRLSNSEKTDYFLSFLNSYLDYKKLKEFNYTKRSIPNYMIVRSKWIEDLGIVNVKGFLKPSAIKIIKEYDRNKIYNELINEINQFEKNNLKNHLLYLGHKKIFLEAYNYFTRRSVIQGYKYVNLYHIKDKMKVSYHELQTFLNTFILDHNYKYKVHFNDIVHSIDGRKRFLIKGVAMINIMITGENNEN